MIEHDKEFFINYPIFLKYKDRFDLFKWQRVRSLKKFNIVERIVEIPFATQSLSAVPSGGKVLDLGCAESIFPLQAACLGYKVTGVDFRQYPYKHPNLSFVQADIMNLPFEEASFDAVCAISTLEHIGLGAYTDPLLKDKPDSLVMRQIARVLKKGGVFILTVPYGKEQLNDFQRIYNQVSLDDLLKDFDMMQSRYFTIFTKENNDRGMYWGEVSEMEAAQVPSGTTTRAVCLLQARLRL